MIVNVNIGVITPWTGRMSDTYTLCNWTTIKVKKLIKAVLAAIVVLFVSLSVNAQTLPGVVSGDTVRVVLKPRTITRYLPGPTKVVHDTVFIAVEQAAVPAPPRPYLGHGDREALIAFGMLLLATLCFIAYFLYRRLQQPQVQQEWPNFAPQYHFNPVFTPTFNPQFNPTTGDIDVTRQAETPEPEMVMVVVRERTTPASDAAPTGENQTAPATADSQE